MKSLFKFALVLFLLAHARPAMPGECSIETGPGWIKGTAQGAPLGLVLSQVAGKGGYEVFLDEALAATPTTFHFQVPVPTEQAIKRIVRPHSSAMVFGASDGQDAASVRKVWVFRQGQELTARYMALSDRNASLMTPSESTAESRDDYRAAYAPAMGASAAGRAIDGKQLLRPELMVRRGGFGTPVLASADPGDGANSLPDTYEMKKAYDQYQVAKHRHESRQTAAAVEQARNTHDGNRQAYRAQRNQEIQQYVQYMKDQF